jgi:rieske iron-sulfur protein
VRPKEGDVLVKTGDASHTPLTPDDIPLSGGFLTAWAFEPSGRIVRNGSRLNQLLLLRFNPTSLAPETLTHAASGVVAYTAICTHSGCDVDTWRDGESHLFCSCHESTFDPRDGARVVDGPAPRPLPALPLRIVDGRLVVAGPFTAPVGYEKG